MRGEGLGKRLRCVATEHGMAWRCIGRTPGLCLGPASGQRLGQASVKGIGQTLVRKSFGCVVWGEATAAYRAG